jgi:DNA ligase-1
MSTPFTKVVGLCQSLEKTPKRNEKIRLLVEFLRFIDKEEITPAVYLILGSVFSGQDPRTLDVSWKTLKEASSKSQIPNSKQIPMSELPNSKLLTIVEVHQTLSQVAEASGKGSRKEKEDLLVSLFSRASLEEERTLKKIIFGEMRHGVGEGMMVKALAEAADVHVDLVEKAQMFSGDIGRVASIALLKGKEGLEKLSLELFSPVQPMLAQVGEDFDTVIAVHEGQTALEHKLDGARVQIHKKRDRVKIFSRHLKEVTDSIPEVVEMIQDEIKIGEAILDGEVIAISPEGKPLPFQELMRRFRRVHEVEASMQDIPVKLSLFDILYLDKKSLIDLHYEERWNFLREIAPEKLLVSQIVTGDVSEAKAFLEEALLQGHEGVMAKSLQSSYTPGARGKRWFKIKPSETLDLVIVAADWGSGRREGWLSNYHLACRDKETGDYWVIGKTFKGLTDEEFTWMTKILQKLKTKEGPYTVYVKPQIVVEVTYNEIQRSPTYKSGFALRFARITRIREDKSPSESDTLTRIKDLYQKQFRYKGKIK